MRGDECFHLRQRLSFATRIFTEVSNSYPYSGLRKSRAPLSKRHLYGIRITNLNWIHLKKMNNWTYIRGLPLLQPTTGGQSWRFTFVFVMSSIIIHSTAHTSKVYVYKTQFKTCACNIFHNINAAPILWWRVWYNVCSSCLKLISLCFMLNLEGIISV